jgi:hypothetical protein
MQRRHWLLALALVATAGASIVAATSGDVQQVGEPVLARERPGIAGAPVPVDLPFELPRRLSPPKRSPDLFAPYSWVPPPQPAAAAPPPPPPPPRLPYTYVGRLVVGSQVSLLLINGSDTVAIAVGDRAGEFELEALDDGAASFRHLPTGESVLLSLPRAP